MSVNDNPSDSESPYRPGGRVDADPLPPDVAANDPRRHIFVNLLVSRVLDGGRCVVTETADCFRGSTTMPTAWVQPYLQFREPQAGKVERFRIPIECWSQKRRQLLALTMRRAAEGVSGPYDAA
jgi:hypothetical protein